MLFRSSLLSLCRSTYQMLLNFSDVKFWSLRTVSKLKKKKEIKESSSCGHVLTQREISQSHVVVSRGATVKNVQKRVMYVQSCCFGNLGQNCTDLPFVFTGPAESCKQRLNLLHFWRPRCCRRRLCLNSLCPIPDCCLQFFSPAEFFAFVLQLYRQAKNMKLMKVLLMLLKRVGLSKRVLMTTQDERGKS